MFKDARLDESTEGAREIDRRTIAKGVAWSVPVVLVATAAPAAATSRMAVSAGLTSVSFDPQPVGNPQLIFSGTAASNEAGQLNFLTVEQAGSQPSALSQNKALSASASNIFTNITATPQFALKPGAVTISYNWTDSRNAVRGSGTLTGTIQPVSFYVANTLTFVKRAGTGNLTVDFKVEITGDPHSKVTISSITGTNNVTWSKVTPGDIALVQSAGKYYASFSADRSPKKDDSSVTITFKIDGGAPVMATVLVTGN